MESLVGAGRESLTRSVKDRLPPVYRVQKQTYSLQGAMYFQTLQILKLSHSISSLLIVFNVVFSLRNIIYLLSVKRGGSVPNYSRKVCVDHAISAALQEVV